MNSRGLHQVGRLITYVQANSGNVTVSDVMAHLGCSYQMAWYYRTKANEILHSRGYCIPKPRYGEGWVWKLTNIWQGDIREAVLEMARYERTHSKTMRGYLEVAYNNPAFNKRSTEGHALRRLLTAQTTNAQTAQDAVDEIEDAIARNP